MTNSLQVFNFENTQTRTIEENGEIWFVAKDVAQTLGYSIDGGMTKYFAHVPDIWKGGKLISTLGGEQEMLCLTEQGLYFFLGRSDKKKALPYQMWIAGDVVPSIRKHGAYLTPKTQEELITDPDFIIKLAREIKAEREKSAKLEQQKQELEAEVNENKPKVVFANSVSASENSILIGSLAKILCQNGVKIGPIQLFEELRRHGFISSQRGERWTKRPPKNLCETCPC
ncbi:MAG: phage antirepressor KilAC domain-containing protein [Synergistaceae bacterium]|nr:phage antirepressor KilAC domain-containing protein [Synergistaceae bacterium]